MSSECRSAWHQISVEAINSILAHSPPWPTRFRGERREERKQEGEKNTAPKTRSAEGPRAPACGTNTTTRQSRRNLTCSNRQTLPVSWGKIFGDNCLGQYSAPRTQRGQAQHINPPSASSGSLIMGRHRIAPTLVNGEPIHTRRNRPCRLGGHTWGCG